MVASKNRFVPELNEKEVITLSNILGAFLIKQLFHFRLLDMRWILPTQHYVPR